MAVPTVASSASNANSTTLTPVITMPGGIQAGDLLIACVCCDDNQTMAWPDGWIEIYEEDAGGNGPTLGIAWRKADETEGESITVTLNGAETASCSCFRITGAEDPDTQPPEVSAEASGSSTGPDPGSLTPTGGAKDYLWIVVGCNDNATITLSAYPTGYGSNQIDEAEGLGAGGVRLYLATKEENDSSDNPDSFTISSTALWEACTIAVHPAAAGITVDATLDTLVITEYNPTLLVPTAVTATLDTLVITEYAADVNLNVTVTAALDTLVITEYKPALLVPTSVIATLDELVITEYAATVKKDIGITAGLDTIVITEYNPTLLVPTAVTATLDALVITEYAADVNLNLTVTATLDVLVITEFNATVTLGDDVNVVATLDTLIITEYAADVNLNVSVTATLDPLVITEYSAAVSLGIGITAGLDTLIITEFNPTVFVPTSVIAGLDTLIITEYNAVVTLGIEIERLRKGSSGLGFSYRAGMR